MRVVIDAMCSEYGGIATYVTNLLAEWPNVYPDDDLHVLAPMGVALPERGLTIHRRVLRRPAAVFRPLIQTRMVRLLARSVSADAVLATLPSTTLLHPGPPLAVVVYDLRHELRPDQFSRRQRLLRSISYGRGYGLADAFVAISRRSLDDLHRLHPRTAHVPGVVAHLAADHVDTWRRRAAEPYAIAFAHHTNKNTDLVIHAWAHLRRGGAPNIPRLRIIGLSATERARVTALLHELDLDRVAEVAPFLPNEEFESVMASAALVVFPSDFEGFGLPVLEAMRLRVPVVVGADRAVLEVAGGHATVMDDWSVPALAHAVEQAVLADPGAIAAAAVHAASFTWARTVRRTRETLDEACRAGAQSRRR